MKKNEIKAACRELHGKQFNKRVQAKDLLKSHGYKLQATDTFTYLLKDSEKVARYVPVKDGSKVTLKDFAWM